MGMEVLNLIWGIRFNIQSAKGIVIKYLLLGKLALNTYRDYK